MQEKKNFFLLTSVIAVLPTANTTTILLISHIQSQAGVLQKSAAWRSGLERRFYDDHNRKVNGSTSTQVSLLRPWIRCFTMIISAWWNLTSCKLRKPQEIQTKNLETQATPKRVWICPTHSASAVFS